MLRMAKRQYVTTSLEHYAHRKKKLDKDEREDKEEKREEKINGLSS